MKKILLDLGTHFGQGLNQFINILKIDDSWDIYSFEANPVTFKMFNGTDVYKNSIFNIQFLNQAVSTKDGKTIINVETPPNEGETGMGSSIIPLSDWNPWNDSLRQNFKSKYEIESINFSEFVKSLGEAEIFCKMDIEGAEFDVLEKMINDNSISSIKEIWIEFHDHFFADKLTYSNRKNEIISYFNKNHIKYNLWH
jgi:FkbM family methyltransferase